MPVIENFVKCQECKDIFSKNEFFHIFQCPGPDCEQVKILCTSCFDEKQRNNDQVCFECKIMFCENCSAYLLDTCGDCDKSFCYFEYKPSTNCHCSCEINSDDEPKTKKQKFTIVTPTKFFDMNGNKYSIKT